MDSNDSHQNRQISHHIAQKVVRNIRYKQPAIFACHPMAYRSANKTLASRRRRIPSMALFVGRLNEKIRTKDLEDLFGKYGRLNRFVSLFGAFDFVAGVKSRLEQVKINKLLLSLLSTTRGMQRMQSKH